MSTSLFIHNVASISVEADSGHRDNGSSIDWQLFTFHDAEGRRVAAITAFLDSPDVALGVGSVSPVFDSRVTAGQDTPVNGQPF